MRRVFPVVLAAAALAGVPATAHAAVEPWADLTLSAAPLAEPAAGATAPLVVTVTRPDASVAVSVDVRTEDGTARAPGDYVALAAPLTLGVGELSKTISVQVRGDRLHERSVESFRVRLVDASGAGVAAEPFTAEIVDDDPYVAFPAVPAGTGTQVDGDYACDGGFYSIAMVSGRRVVNCLGGSRWATDLIALTGPLRATESDADRTETFTLVQSDDVAYSTPAIYAYELVDGGGDVVTSGSVTFNSYQTVASIELPIPGDDVVTGDRSYALRLKAGTYGAWLPLPLTVVEDDVAPPVDTTPPATPVGDERAEVPAPPAPAPVVAAPAPAAPRAVAPDRPTTAPLTITSTPTPLATALRSGVGLAIALRRPARVTTRLMLSDRDRRALGLRYRTAGLKTIQLSGSAKVHVRLSAEVRRALARRGRTLKLTARIGGVGAAREIPVRLER